MRRFWSKSKVLCLTKLFDDSDIWSSFHNSEVVGNLNFRLYHVVRKPLMQVLLKCSTWTILMMSFMF